MVHVICQAERFNVKSYGNIKRAQGFSSRIANKNPFRRRNESDRRPCRI